MRLRQVMNRYWSCVLLWLCGVDVQIHGKPRMGAPVLWVANHVSWVDIFVLNIVRPTAFVAKSEIRNWPVIGWLVAGAGTVFIERGNRQAIRAVGEQMKQRFDQGQVVGLFPEGTTSSGFDVAPFHSSLFDAAIRAQIDIQPVALRFFHQGRRSAYNAFVGEQTLVGNLWCLLGASGVRVQVEFLPVISSERCMELGRARVADYIRSEIRAAISIDQVVAA
jgi:1-acyl-sn-glycerol-3-phosphate acyltransferase